MRIDSNGIRKTTSGPGVSTIYFPKPAFGGPEIVWRKRYGKRVENVKRRRV